jgi:hypothetical protein
VRPSIHLHTVLLLCSFWRRAEDKMRLPARECLNGKEADAGGVAMARRGWVNSVALAFLTTRGHVMRFKVGSARPGSASFLCVRHLSARRVAPCWLSAAYLCFIIYLLIVKPYCCVFYLDWFDRCFSSLRIHPNKTVLTRKWI